MENKTKTHSDIAQLNRYVEMTNRIRELSSPLLESVSNAEEYRVKLLDNFLQIGEIARGNNRILDTYYYPLINTDVNLPDDTVNDMRTFADAMLNAFTLENLDVPMMYLQAKKILDDARKKGETGGILRALDEFVIVSYAIIYITKRLMPCFDIAARYREEGLKAAEEILEYLEPERFLALPDVVSREIVLINSRYIVVFFSSPTAAETREEREHNLNLLKRALSLCDEPFYREQMPEYDWDYHRFRTLEYIARQSEGNNENRYDADELLFIKEKARAYIACVKDHPDRFSGFVSERMLALQTVRDDYLTGTITVSDYKNRLREIMDTPAADASLKTRLEQYFIIPLEYIRVLDPGHLSAEDKAYLPVLYRRLIVNMHQLRKKSISYMLSYMADILSEFIETEGGMSFEDMTLSLMVALHPPTYVHTLSVADFATCIAGYVIDRMPERLTGFMGLATEEDVKNHREEILDFTFHAACCHDVGKLFINETIMMYGRSLYRSEFDLIQAHPETGAFQLEKHESTRRYANIARGHHKWYDDSGGYPSGFMLKDCQERAIIEIITVADCLDAATDAVGRSYKEGKTPEAFWEELRAGSGTRYAPYLAELLFVPEVKEDLCSRLVSCRDENYRKAFRLLEELERQSV